MAGGIPVLGDASQDWAVHPQHGSSQHHAQSSQARVHQTNKSEPNQMDRQEFNQTNKNEPIKCTGKPGSGKMSGTGSPWTTSEILVTIPLPHISLNLGGQFRYSLTTVKRNSIKFRTGCHCLFFTPMCVCFFLILRFFTVSYMYQPMMRVAQFQLLTGRLTLLPNSVF